MKNSSIDELLDLIDNTSVFSGYMKYKFLDVLNSDEWEKNTKKLLNVWLSSESINTLVYKKLYSIIDDLKQYM